MSEALRKPDWIPYYIQRMKGSKAYKGMQDFEFGWYSKLLVESADSDVPGYLPNDVRTLWRLAGARTEKFFQERGGMELVARYFSRTDDGLWIYNSRMLEVLHEQMTKLTKRRKSRISSLSLSLQELPSWIPGELFMQYVEMRKSIGKEITGNAVKLAIGKLEKLKAHGHGPKEVLEQSIFRSWAGLFEIEQVTNGKGNHGTGSPESHNPAQGNGSRFAQEGCGSCQGTGWDCTSGKAVRCECFKRAKAHAANGTAK